MNIAFSPFPELTTERLLLRRLDLADYNELIQLRSDDRVNQYLNRKKSMNDDEATDFVAKIDQTITENKGCYWVISLAENRKLIGTICLWNFEPEKGLAEIGYELMPPYQGKGIMYEAINSITAYAFAVMQAETIMAATHPGNVASQRLLEKCGFKRDMDDAEGQYVYQLTGKKD